MSTITREHLPGRRQSITQKAVLNGQTIYLTLGEYPDGRLGEVFLDLARCGSVLRAFGNALAVFLSIGLQHGVPLALFVNALKGVSFEPCGPVTGSEEGREAESILDYIAQQIEAFYLQSEQGERS